MMGFVERAPDKSIPGQALRATGAKRRLFFSALLA